MCISRFTLLGSPFLGPLSLSRFEGDSVELQSLSQLLAAIARLAVVPLLLSQSQLRPW